MKPISDPVSQRTRYCSTPLESYGRCLTGRSSTQWSGQGIGFGSYWSTLPRKLNSFPPIGRLAPTCWLLLNRCTDRFWDCWTFVPSDRSAACANWFLTFSYRLAELKNLPHWFDVPKMWLVQAYERVRMLDFELLRRYEELVMPMVLQRAR